MAPKKKTCNDENVYDNIETMQKKKNTSLQIPFYFSTQIGTLSGEATLPILPTSYTYRSKLFPLRVVPSWKDFVIQGSKQEITIVSLCKYGRKTW